jgi:ketosteroid isomerase-like protein
MKAMCRGDVPALDALLDDDLVYTHSSARVDTKQSLLDGMESGTTVYTAIEPSEVRAQVFDDAVVLTGVARIGVTANGRPLNFGVRFTDVYVNAGGPWRMVAWQSTRLPG